MKICILTPRFPFPQYGGDTLRINEIARYLKTQGHKLILVSLSDVPNPPVEKARDLYDAVHYVKRNKIFSLINCILGVFNMTPLQCSYYYSQEYKKTLKEVIEKEKPDLYISHLLRMVPYLDKLDVCNKTIVEMTDALSKTYGLSSNAKGVGLLKYVYMFEKYLIKRYEQYVIKKFPKVVLVSQTDINLLRSEAKTKIDSLALHTNGVYCSKSQQEIEYDENKICFMGNMRSIQNQDAALFFANEIFPLIKKELPNSKFYIVGSLPPANILSLASEDIIVTGFVDDLESFVSDSCIAVAPVRIAAGIQNKVLVSMGCGVPVVLTSLISGAIHEIKDKKNARIVDTPKEIAEACIELMQNKEERKRIALSGQEMVIEHYSWNKKLFGYEKI